MIRATSFKLEAARTKDGAERKPKRRLWMIKCWRKYYCVFDISTGYIYGYETKRSLYFILYTCLHFYCTMLCRAWLCVKSYVCLSAMFRHHDHIWNTLNIISWLISLGTSLPADSIIMRTLRNFSWNRSSVWKSGFRRTKLAVSLKRGKNDCLYGMLSSISADIEMQYLNFECAH